MCFSLSFSLWTCPNWGQIYWTMLVYWADFPSGVTLDLLGGRGIVRHLWPFCTRSFHFCMCSKVSSSSTAGAGCAWLATVYFLSADVESVCRKLMMWGEVVKLNNDTFEGKWWTCKGKKGRKKTVSPMISSRSIRGRREFHRCSWKPDNLDILEPNLVLECARCQFLMKVAASCTGKIESDGTFLWNNVPWMWSLFKRKHIMLAAVLSKTRKKIQTYDVFI